MCPTFKWIYNRLCNTRTLSRMSSLQNGDRHALKDRIVRNVCMMLIKTREPLLVSKICEYLEYVDAAGLMKIIHQYPRQFQYADDEQSLIRLVTKIRVCEIHCSKMNTRLGGKAPCSDLHICKFYIGSGNCDYGEDCRFGHDLTTEHNVKILQSNLLSNVSVENLRYVLHTSVKVPRICKYYNVGTKCRNLESGAPCPCLHICRHYVFNNCKFAVKCKRNHNITNPDVQLLLKKYGIQTNRKPKEILAVLREANEPETNIAKESIADNRETQISVTTKHTNEPRTVKSAPGGIHRFGFEQGHQKLNAETSSYSESCIAVVQAPVTASGDCATADAIPKLKDEQQSEAISRDHSRPKIHINLNADSVSFRYMSELCSKKKKSDSDKQCLSEVWVSDYTGKAKVVAFCVDANGKLHHYSLYGNKCVQGVYTNSCVIKQGVTTRLVGISIMKPKMAAYMETQENVMKYLRQTGVLGVEAGDEIKAKDVVYLKFIVTFEDSEQTLSIMSPPLYDNRSKSQREKVRKRHVEEVPHDKTDGKKRRHHMCTEDETAVTASSISITPSTTEPEERRERAAFQSYYSRVDANQHWGNFIDTAGNQESALTWKARGEALCSVCLIRFPGGTGTGFRVGVARNYIMTAAHVVDAILKTRFHQQRMRNIQLDDVDAVFKYLKEGEIASKHTFSFINKIHFKCDRTDTAILEICDHNDDEPMPPPFTLFGDQCSYKSFCFIGHSEGNPMEINTVDKIVDMHGTIVQTDITNVTKWSLEHTRCSEYPTGKEYESPPHQTVMNPDKVLFHCKFTQGASGSPGVVILNDGRKAVVTMLLAGYPMWYYEPNMKQFQDNWSKDKLCVEQGVNMPSVYNIMEKKNLKLFNEIFCVAN